MAAKSELETVLPEVFADLADVFGNPPSHGLVFGLLFASSEALAQEQIAERLGLSMGAVSMALRALEGFGAVERLSNNGSRAHATYTANRNLRPLVVGFVHNRLRPKLEASLEKLDRLQEQFSGDALNSDEEKQIHLLQKVRNWHKRAVQILDSADFLLNLSSKGNY